MGDLRNRVIIITGASSGIGAATAVQCARAGMDCVLNAKRERRLEDVAEQVRRAGRRAICVSGCVASDVMSRRLLDAAEAEFGRFDAVFANAGFGCNQPALEITEREMREMFEVNFFAAYDLVSQAAKRLIAARLRGHLLMCSSCLGRFAFPMHGPYAATKAAQAQMCATLRAELRPHGIHVSSVMPITTRTEFFISIARRAGRTVEGDGIPDYCPRFMVQSPQRVAKAVVRCLRRPRPEVWTSPMVRAFAAVATLWPWPLEVVCRRHVRREMRNREQAPAPSSLDGARAATRATVTKV